MKTMKQFVKNNSFSNVKTMSKIFGGSQGVSQSAETHQNGCGSCTKITSTDVYEDCNGNGKWDRGESGTVTQTYEDVKCSS